MQERSPVGDENCRNWFGSELEAHEVISPAYYLNRTEVTVAAYQRCVERGGCSLPYASGGERLDRPDSPVTLVIVGRGERILSVRRWTPPHRGRVGTRGTRDQSGDVFRGANSTTRISPTTARSRSTRPTTAMGSAELAPVGSFPLGRTPDGIDDLAGNVEEWVADAIDDTLGAHYSASSEVNPKGASGGAGPRCPRRGLRSRRCLAAIRRPAAFARRANASRHADFAAPIRLGEPGVSAPIRTKSAGTNSRVRLARWA